MSARTRAVAYCPIFDNAIRAIWFSSDPAVSVLVAAAGHRASPVATQWILFPSHAESDSVLRTLKLESRLFIAGQFHLDVDGGTAIVRILKIGLGVRRPGGLPLLWEIADAKPPPGWLTSGAVQ
jgi:hypothetical protein